MEKRVVALGFFDGVHLGHGSLLTRAKVLAEEYGCRAAAVTFDRQPAAVIRGGEPMLLSSGRDREYLIRSLYGLEEVIFLHFGRAMMELPWEDFLQSVLVTELQACHVVCGFDYRFGFRGAGNAALLREFCRSRGIGCDILPEFSLDGVPVHSTEIRRLLREGQLEAANRLLGHPYVLSGTVVSGKQLGRTLGTPTANVDTEVGLIPLPAGVYVTEASFEDHVYAAVTNVGTCPTVNGTAMTVEAWLPEFSGNLYGKLLRLNFLKLLRPEQKFGSLAELRAAILGDGAAAMAYFHSKGNK